VDGIEIAIEWEWAALALAAAMVVLLPLELWHLYKKRVDRRRWLELLASASPVLPTVMMGAVVTAFIVALNGGAAALAPWSIPTTPLTVLLSLLAVDFLYY